MTNKCKNLKIVVAAAIDLQKESLKEKMRQPSSKKIMRKFIDSIITMKLEPLSPFQTVVMFTDKTMLDLGAAKIPAERKEFNEAFIKFIVSDSDFQNQHNGQDEI